jgi:polysaccharide biosynthesis/export protein
MKSGGSPSQAGVRVLLALSAVIISAIPVHAQDSTALASSQPLSASVPSKGGSTGPSAATNLRDTSAIPDPAVRLGAGDLVDVSVYGVSDLQTKTRVGNNGDIYLPLIDYVHVAGLTLDEAQRVIEKRFVAGGFLVDPHVSVFIDEYASQGVNVLGEVNHPGVYPVLGKQRLLDVVAAAGGLSEKAGQTVTVSHRDQPGRLINVSLRGNAAAEEDNAIQVLPGDTVIVHKADVVYVVGDVSRPSGLMMDGGSLTVLQAIALVGGTTRTSKLSGVRIIHKEKGGMTETVVPLKKILQAKAPDVPLQANDILFVPSSAAKAAAAKSMDAIAQTASALTLIAVRP